MLNFYQNDLDILISILIISIVVVTIYHFLKCHGKIYLHIYLFKITFNNKNQWENAKEISDDTKWIDLDFTLQIYNNQNHCNSIYNLGVYNKNKSKYNPIENNYLNLLDTKKSASGTTTYEKLKYFVITPFEVKEFRVNVKLTKEEYSNLNKNPIYLFYKVGRRKKKIKINKFLKRKK